MEMVDARQLVDWDRTAFIVWKIHNVNCAVPSHRISDPLAFNPLRQKKKTKPKMTLKEVRKAMEG